MNDFEEYRLRPLLWEMAERYSDITETYLSYLEKGWNNSTKLLFLFR